MFWIIDGDAICKSLPAVTDAPRTRFLAAQVEHRCWAVFFTVVGTNAILVYFGQQVVDFDGVTRFLVTGVERYAGIDEDGSGGRVFIF